MCKSPTPRLETHIPRLVYCPSFHFSEEYQRALEYLLRRRLHARPPPPMIITLPCLAVGDQVECELSREDEHHHHGAVAPP